MTGRGCLHVYCGEGKGKTTAAIGLGVRACGAGLGVVLAQFLKTGRSAEREALCGLPGFFVLPCPGQLKFVFQMGEEERGEEAARNLHMLRLAFQAARERKAGLVILDEVCGAVETGMLREDDLLEAIRSRPEGMEVVATGRNPGAGLLELADYITEMKKHRHPYDKGLAARYGIEW